MLVLPVPRSAWVLAGRPPKILIQNREKERPHIHPACLSRATRLPGCGGGEGWSGLSLAVSRGTRNKSTNPMADEEETPAPKRKVFVQGVSGYVGGNVAKRFAAEGASR